MPIEGFDYKEFAKMMSSQAAELVPKKFNEMQRNYVVKTLTNFTLLAGEAISNDTKLNFNADQAVFVTQIIAEWSFHKSIDLVHSGIMPEHWDNVMQKIAFTIFEIAKQAIQKNIPQDKALQLIEHHVDKTYKECIADLEKRGIISSEISKKAARQSNIDEMAKQVQEQEAKERAKQRVQKRVPPARKGVPRKQLPQGTEQNNAPSEKKLNKLKSLAMVIKLLDETRAEEVLSKFPPEIVTEVMKYVNTQRLEEQIDIEEARKCLEDLKIVIPKTKKLSQNNIIKEMDMVFKENDMEEIEMLVKSERPFVKRFVSQAYEGDYCPSIPLKVSKILVEYIKSSCKNKEQ